VPAAGCGFGGLIISTALNLLLAPVLYLRQGRGGS
jgi:multidrug efflux pump subunit AcrB